MKLSESVIVRRSARLVVKALRNLTAISGINWLNWGGPIHESYPGAWQQNVTLDSQTSILAFSAVYACVTGIASDIAKVRIKLVENQNGIWEERSSGLPWLPVLRDPNHFQNRIEFIEQWIISKLLHGNAYIFKERADKRGIVTAMYVLDPSRVTVLIAEDGSVYYQLKEDALSQVSADNPTVPASEIIHDRMPSLWHPLIGVSPIYACGTSATMGNKIQSNSTNLFGNLSRPGGVVMFPVPITKEQAADFKDRWEAGFGAGNIGRTAILDNGSKFEPISMPALEAQLIEQLRWTVEDVARAFHYPPWKLWSGTMPAYTKPDLAMTAYYSDCLQSLIEKIELCLDRGLELPTQYGTEMDLDNLMRMDSDALADSITKSGPYTKLNEQRFRAGLHPLPIGGDTVYKQEQDHSIEALAKRDAQEDPFAASKAKATIPPATEPPAQPTAREMSFEDFEFFEAELRKELELA